MNRTTSRTVLAMTTLGLAVGCSKPAPDRANQAPPEASTPSYTTASYYVPMRDGVRLAVDVHLPSTRGPNDRLPALLELTRYGRAYVDAKTGPKPPLRRVDFEFIGHG